jgi:hypothetical protein
MRVRFAFLQYTRNAFSQSKKNIFKWHFLLFSVNLRLYFCLHFLLKLNYIHKKLVFGRYNAKFLFEKSKNRVRTL